MLRQAPHRLRIAPDPERDLICCRLPLTDLGNAERWRARFGADFRFCAELGWLAWDGRRWKLLSEEKDRSPAAVIWSIAATVRAIRNEAALVAASGCVEPDTLGPAQKHKFKLLSEQAATEGWERYVGREDAPAEDPLHHPADGPPPRAGEDLERFVNGTEEMDFVVDLAKDKLFSTTLRNFAKASEAAASIGKIVGWVKGFPDIVVRPDQLDADRMAINVLNGTLRLLKANRKRTEQEKQDWLARHRKTGPAEGPQGRTAARSRPGEAGNSGEDGAADAAPQWKSIWAIKRFAHDRGDLITKLAPVTYRPNARCPEYDAFIARVQPDAADRRFVHQWGGLSLTGDVGEQKLAFFYGTGGNGKGTWVELVAHVAGDYAGSIPIESFLENGIKRRGDQATPDIARLPGVRFLRVSEPEKGSALNEGLIKMVTGGDPVDARHLNKGFFTFLPSFKMTISGNHKPRIKDTSDGIWRRMQLVPWEVSIPRDEQDRGLDAKLRAEASGVLNRLLEGLLDWRVNGLIEPESVRKATRAYRDESDDLGRFLHDICEVSDDPMVRCGAMELYALYEAWAGAAGGAPWKIKGFRAAMLDKGFEQKPSDGMKWLRVRPRAGASVESVRAGDFPDAIAPGPDGSAAGDPGGGVGWPSGEGGDWVPDDGPPPGWET